MAKKDNNWVDPFQESVDKLQAKYDASKRGIASGLKDLSKKGKLTADLLKEARQRAFGAGVSDEQFDSFLSQNRINTNSSGQSGFTQATPTSSPEEAAQNVMFQKQFGSGLKSLAAMQDPNYELGSGSSLRQPARQIGTKSGALRRAARRLRKQGYGAQAGQFAADAEMLKLTEPSITTPATRAADMANRITAGRLRQQEDQLMAANRRAAANMSNIGMDAGEEEYSETQRRDAKAKKRKAKRDLLSGNRLNSTRNR